MRYSNAKRILQSAINYISISTTCIHVNQACHLYGILPFDTGSLHSVENEYMFADGSCLQVIQCTVAVIRMV